MIQISLFDDVDIKDIEQAVCAPILCDGRKYVEFGLSITDEGKLSGWARFLEDDEIP